MKTNLRNKEDYKKFLKELERITDIADSKECLKELEKLSKELGIDLPSSPKLYFKDDEVDEFINFMEKEKEECNKIIDRNFKEITVKEKDTLRHLYPFFKFLLEVTHCDEESLLCSFREIHQNYNNAMRFLSCIIDNELKEEIEFEDVQPYVIYELIENFIKDFSIIDNVNSLIINDNGKYYMVKRSENYIPFDQYKVIPSSELSFDKVKYNDNIIVTTETEEKEYETSMFDNEGEENYYEIIDTTFESNESVSITVLLESLKKLVEKIPKALFENSDIVALQDDEQKRIYILKNRSKNNITHIDSNEFKYIQNGLININFSNNMVTEDDKNIMIVL